jgi:hypothetical protein
MLPFHVLRFSEGDVEVAGKRDAEVVEPERARGETCGFIGEGGAYISVS